MMLINDLIRSNCLDPMAPTHASRMTAVIANTASVVGTRLAPWPATLTFHRDNRAERASSLRSAGDGWPLSTRPAVARVGCRVPARPRASSLLPSWPRLNNPTHVRGVPRRSQRLGPWPPPPAAIAQHPTRVPSHPPGPRSTRVASRRRVSATSTKSRKSRPAVAVFYERNNLN